VRLKPAVIAKLSNIAELASIPQPAPAGGSFLAGGLEFRIPLSEGVNVEEEAKKLQQELDYTRGFLDSVERKLGNERFMQNAKPEVVAAEEKKKADAQTKIRQLEEQLTALKA
jgi:valyl-tRNA synthetase